MTEIHKNLFVGNEADYELKVKNQEGWNVIHACKEPYHRQALGYSGRGAPKDHPEYLMAKRENLGKQIRLSRTGKPINRGTEKQRK